MKKILKLLFSFCIFLLLCFSSLTVYADYYITGTELNNQPVSKTFEVKAVLGTFGGKTKLNNPEDMFISNDNKIYIADTGNNRIVKTDLDNKVLQIYSGSYGKENKPLNKPMGVFVDNIGHIYIADTDNGRIVHLKQDGSFVEEFIQPKEDTYDRSYIFKPMKLAIDNMGIIYVANAYDYHGILTIDPANRFLGYIGATKVGFNVEEWFVRLFATNEQKQVLAKQMPAYFSNFILKDGLIYSTSFWDDKNQIKKLTPAGNNIYPIGFYGEKNTNEMFNMLPGFSDVAVDKNNIVYAADLVVGKIYVYDMDGRNLAVFGGSGRREGRFEAISSINVDSDGNLYVLDKVCEIVQVFNPTNLMANVLKATKLYQEGRYSEAITPWKNVLEYDSTNLLANLGIAKSAYGKGEYKKSMDLYFKSFNKEGYSKAFSEYRLDIYRKYFLFIIICIAFVFVLFSFILKKARRYADKQAELNFCPEGKFMLKHVLKTAYMMIIHPIDCVYGIKSARKKIKYWHISILLLALIFVRIVYIYIVHFPLADISILTVDLFQQIALLIIPLISFIIVAFGITSISDGKQTFKEAAYASLAAFMPYILFSLPVGVLSHIMSGTEKGLYDMFTIGLLIWSIILLLLTVMEMNEYSLKKLVTTVLKTIFGIICLWMIVLLFYIIVYQAISFFKNLFIEINIAINR